MHTKNSLFYKTFSYFISHSIRLAFHSRNTNTNYVWIRKPLAPHFLLNSFDFHAFVYFAFCLHFPIHFSSALRSLRQIAFQRSSLASAVVRSLKFRTKSCSKFDFTSALGCLHGKAATTAAACVIWEQICCTWHANCIQYCMSMHVYIYVCVCIKFRKDIIRKYFEIFVLLCLLVNFSYWFNSISASDSK